MRHELLSLEEIVPDPDNCRKEFDGIEELAQSIHDNGLLQNLVVREVSDGGYQLSAGERRYRAVCLLRDSDRWHDPVLCLVIDTSGSWEQIIENVFHQPLPLWELGQRYSEFIEAGYTQDAIAARVGKTQGHVSVAIQVARGLAPDTIGILRKLGDSPFSQTTLLRIAKFYHPETLEPDATAQIDEIRRLLGVKRRRRFRTSNKDSFREQDRVWSRYQSIKRGKSIPSHALPYVTALMSYLAGDSERLTFDR